MTYWATLWYAGAVVLQLGSEGQNLNDCEMLTTMMLTDIKQSYADPVLKAQLDMYQDVSYTDKKGNQSIPIVNDMDALADFSTNKDWVDFAGRMIYDKDGKELFNFGKHKGKRVEDVFAKEPSYYDWMMNGDFALSTKRALEKIKTRGLINKFNA